MRSAALLGLLLALPLAGCTSPSAQARVDVLASFYPVQFLAERVASGHLAVGVLVPAGVEPHDYELTPGDTASVQRARLVAYHGAGLEAFADALRALADGAQVPVVEAAAGLDLATRDLGEEHGADPHLWLDPLRAAQEARNLEAALARVDPANASSYGAGLASLTADLAQLDREYRDGLAACAKHKIITTHAAFGYVADRYNFTQIPITGLEPEADPSAEKLREVADLARRENITVIFFETLVSPRVAQVIADEVHGRTEVLDPVEGLTDEAIAAGQDYLSVMRDNLRNLRDAMECA
ncbi:MAG TPA: zinc ABC transporter substrate-binding protein [Candidatus Thermoplasmatota archaeon]|nr:zinc ABC transporter substrate-binding protein [Candidatus Thermoplasmatota archaeon]